MRFFSFVLLLIAIIFATSTDAASAIKEDHSNQVSAFSASDLDFLARVAELNGDDKRLLRSVAETDGIDDSAGDEERALRIPAWLANLWKTMSTKAKDLGNKWLTKAFEHMDKAGETPTKLAQRLNLRLDGGGGAMEKRYMKLFEKYSVWWMNKYDLVAGGVKNAV